jgi:UDP-glucose 4-epimerase
MKILVVGSEGSLMQATIPYLLKKHEVYGIDLKSRRQTIYNYEYQPMDAADDWDWSGEIYHYRPDAIIQAAAQVYGVAGFHEHGESILEGDLKVQMNAIDHAKMYKVQRLIYISSSMVYERCIGNAHEEDAFNAPTPSTEYGLSKLVGERLLLSSKIPYTVWRPFNIITPYEEAGKEIGISHVFADMIENIVTKRLNPLPIIGDGNQIRCFTWINEVAEAIAFHSFSDRTLNRTYNLGNAEPINMKGLAQMIVDVAKEMNLLDASYHLTFKTVKTYNDDVQIRIPNVEKAYYDLEWVAKVKLKESIRYCLHHKWNQKAQLHLEL